MATTSGPSAWPCCRSSSGNDVPILSRERPSNDYQITKHNPSWKLTFAPWCPLRMLRARSASPGTLAPSRIVAGIARNAIRRFSFDTCFVSGQLSQLPTCPQNKNQNTLKRADDRARWAWVERAEEREREMLERENWSKVFVNLARILHTP